MSKRIFESRRTPQDADYNSCCNAFLEFIVYSEGKAEEITFCLDLIPSYSQNAGQSIKNSNGGIRKAKTTYWCLSSENSVCSKDIRHHLIWLIEKLSKKERSLKKLQGQPGVAMSVNCNWWSKGTGGPTIWPEQMSGLSQLNLELTFNIHFDE